MYGRPPRQSLRRAPLRAQHQPWFIYKTEATLLFGANYNICTATTGTNFNKTTTLLETTSQIYSAGICIPVAPGAKTPRAPDHDRDVVVGTTTRTQDDRASQAISRHQLLPRAILPPHLSNYWRSIMTSSRAAWFFKPISSSGSPSSNPIQL